MSVNIANKCYNAGNILKDVMGLEAGFKAVPI